MGVEEELTGTRNALLSSLGQNNYQKYLLLLESFLCGKITKEELESSLRLVLADSLINYDLHNKYVGLVLEKLAKAENEAIASCTDNTSNINNENSPTLQLSSISIDANDVKLIEQAKARKIPIIPHQITPAQRQSKYLRELGEVERRVGKPLLCQITKRIPDSEGIKLIINSWCRAYDLNGSIDDISDELISLLQQGLDAHLRSAIKKAISRVAMSPTTESAKTTLDVEAFRDFAIMQSISSSLISHLFQ